MVNDYQPYWAVAAHLLSHLRRVDEAKAAYARAIELSVNPAERHFLEQQRAALVPSS